MKKEWKYIYYCLLIFCGGFAVLEYMDGSPKRATMWMLGLAVTVLVWTFLNQKPRQPQSALQSLLSEEQQQALAQGKELHFHPEGIRLRSNENCLWYDNAALDYYDGKKGTMYLSNERLFFIAPDFSFTHPLHTLELKQTRNGVEIEVYKKKMRFVTASTPLLLKVWKEAEQYD